MIALLAALLAVITAPYAPASYACNGSTAVFQVPFPYQAYTDLSVTSTTAAGIATTLAYTTNYTVNVTSTDTTATLTLANPVTSCPSGNTLAIARAVEFTQRTSFRTQYTFNAALHEMVYDRLEMQIQQLNAVSPANTATQSFVENYVNNTLSGGSAVQPLSWTLTGDGATTTFSLPSAAVVNAALYQVTIDGVTQAPTTDYTVSLTPQQIVFTAAPALNAAVVVRSLGYARALNVSDNSFVLATGTSIPRDLAHWLGDIKNAAAFGADSAGANDSTAAIQAAINATSGIAVIPPGTYKTASTITLPVTSNGAFSLVMDGVTVNYSGSGYAFEASGAGQPYVNLRIRGGRVVGTSSGLAGLHLVAFNRMRIEGTSFEGFTTGDGVFNEGANTIVLVDAQLKGNKNGLHNVGKVVSAVNYSANAVTMYGGHIAANTQYGYWGDGALSATVGPNIANSFFGVTFECNGNAGAGRHVFLQASDTEGFYGSYFENCTGSQWVSSAIELGDGTYTPKNAQFMGNWFGSASATNTFLLTRSSFTSISGSNETAALTNFINATANAIGLTIGPNIAQAASNFFAGSGSYNYQFNTLQGTIALIAPMTATKYVSSGSNFAGLGTPSAGTITYCSDCTIANPCAGGGTGAIAKRLNGVWVCN